MKKIVSILFLIPPLILAQNVPTAYKTGEKLTYKVQYGPVVAGVANLEVTGSQKEFTYLAKGRSTGVFNLFFKVRDTYKSVVDKSTLKPIWFYRDIKEGNYKKKEKVFFNYELQQAESTRDTISLPKNTQDILSIFYYLRSQNFNALKVGDHLSAQMYLDDEFIHSNLYYLGVDTIKTKFGRISCTKWAPELQTGRVFEDRQGLELWISNDANKIPVQVKAKVMVGSIKMELTEVKGARESFKSIK